MKRGSVASPLVSAIAHLPFGPAGAYTFGNGDTLRRTFDQDYRPTGVISTPLYLQYTLDALGNLVALTDAPAQSAPVETYAYDPLNRLQQVDHAGAPWQSFTLNQTGDRLSKTTAGLGTDQYHYAAGTHHLTSITGIDTSGRELDANGNTTLLQAGGWAYKLHYNDTNRLARVRQGGTPIMHYLLNGQGQRVSKITLVTPAHGCKKHKHGKKRKKHCKPKPGAATDFVYDRAGYLLAEYGEDASRAYIWADNTLVAVLDNPLQGEGDVINYVYTDQLGAPRAMTTQSGATIWTWSPTLNPFGERAPSDDGYTFNLRYPGQYFDAETGLNYNYFRDYEAATGRYIESDPIGLMGGLSTYGYAGGNPISFYDPDGLEGVGPWTFPPGPLRDRYIAVQRGRYTLNISLGAGGFAQVGINSVSIDSGIAVDTTGNVCVYSTICPGVGVGLPVQGELGT